MNLREIEYFLRLCKEKNISSAARKLFITQQGLSKAVKKMEDELTFPLFDRGKRELTLTYYGRTLYQYALECQDIQKRMNHCIKRLQSENRLVRIGTTMGVSLSLRPTALAELHTALAPALFEIVETTDFACEDEVENGGVDFGVTVGPVDQERFWETPLKHGPMYAVINEHHPLAHKSKISIVDLRGERIITASPSFKSYHRFVECCEGAGFTPEIDSTTMEMMVIYTKSLHNQGIGISSDLPNSNLKYPGVLLIPFDEAQFSWQYSLIISKKHTLSKFDNFVRDIIIQIFS